MANSVNAVTCIKGEIHSIMTLMRLNTRWSSTRGGRDNYSNDEENLMQPFRLLNEYLGGRFSLEDVDCVMYIMPFHNVVVSNTASGPLTTAALNSLTKFALYGFLADHYPRVQEGITLVANCVSRCVYPETDWESDEMILMKLLELSTLCYRSGAARLLTIASAWEMYSTCIAMHNHYKASRILKSDAENALVHLTLSVFGRIARMDASAEWASTAQELEMLRHRTWESVRDNYNMSSEVGVILLLTKIMVVLSEMADLQKHSVETVKFALVLINIALEAGGPSLGLVKPLVEILSNDVCRHLLRASQSEDLAIISLGLRVVFNLFVSIKNHMKVQLEVFLISVHLRLIGSPGNGASTPVPGSGTSATQAAYAALGAAREELALESLLEFCREPSLMNDIYVNYDCDMQCTNLFESIITALCSRALPKELLAESSFGSGQRKADAQKGATGGRTVEAASPSQVFSYGSSGGLFGLDAPLAPPATVGGPNTPLRLSIANRLALDGVLAVLRSLAGQAGPPAVLYSRHNGAPASNTADEVVGVRDVTHGAARGEDLDQQVDKWCNSGSTSPTSDILSQEGHDRDSGHAAGPSNGNSVAGAPAYQRQVTTGSRGGDHFGSVTDSPYSTHSTNSRSRSIEPNPVDGENEVTAAVLLARSRHAEMLRERRLMKQKLKVAAEKFNKKPLKPDWIRFAMDLGILQPTRPVHENETAGSHDQPSGAEVREPSTGIDATAVAQFLRRTPGLGKTQIGEYISKGPANLHPFHALVLREYVRTFDFSGEHSSFDAALRLFLGEFRLPGESQCIDRLMEAFAGRLFEHLGPGKPFANADAAFILAFSTIMLNTDLHNPQIPQSKKMTKAEFIRNNRGINDNKDLPQEYLERLYDEIKNRQIQVDIDMSDAATAPAMVDLADSTMWNKVLHKGAVDQAPAAFTSTLQARRASLGPGEMATEVGSTVSDVSRARGSSVAESLPHAGEGGEVPLVRGRAPYEKDYFLVMSKPVLETLIALLSAVTEDLLLGRLLRGLWDYIKICADFGMDATLSSIVQLLCLRTRSLIDAERAIALRPFTRRNVLAHASRYKQLQADTGLDLAAFLCLDMDVLLSDADAHGTAHTQSPAGGAEARERQWAYTSLIKGEILLKLAFHTALLSHPCMREPSWTAAVKLLMYCRSRGALPPVLALVSEGFTPRTSDEAASSEAAKLPPSPYAHRCYLEAYGLTLSYPGQNGQRDGSTGDAGSVGAQGGNPHNSSSGGGSWLGFLFSDGQNSEHSDRAAVHSGTLDLPNLYCNTNASGCVDMTCEPLRPDDALLRVALKHSNPEGLLFGQRDEEEHFAQTSLVLRTLFHSLTDMLETLTMPAAKGLQANGGASLFKASLTKDFQSLSHIRHEDEDVVNHQHEGHREGALSLILPSDTARETDHGDAFPAHLLEPATSGAKWSEAKELDTVTVLEWAEKIVLRDESHIQYFWPDLYGFLRLILEENVDLVAARCPYLLERCVGAVLRAAIRVVSAAGSAATLGAFRPHRQPLLTSSLLQRAATQAVSRHASCDAVWKALRLMRGVPSEVVANLSDRLGAGVLELLRVAHSQGLEITADRWFLLFSLLSAATSGPPGRPFVWSALTMLMDNDLICETNFTASRHLVLRFAHGVFPGDASEEQRNKISGAASAQLHAHPKQAGQSSTDEGGHVIEAISYLLRICLMALAGYGQHRPEVVAERVRPGVSLGSIGGNGTAFSPVTSAPSTVSFLLPSVLRAKGREGKPSAAKSPLALVTSPSGASGSALPTSGSQKSRDAGALSVAGSGSDKDDSVIEVRRVVLQRAEEVEAVWVETCKALADLVSSPIPNASFQASYSLEAVLSAGTRSEMPDTLLVKILGDLVQRLPLAMHSTAGGSHAVRAMSVESVAACQRSCNIIFDLVVQKMKVLREMEAFYAIWARIVSTLAANAMTGAARGHQWWHDEMCDTLEALLRLLRLPAAAQGGPSRGVGKGEGKGAAVADQATSAPSPAAGGRSQGTSGGGLFGWLIGPLVAATDAPTAPAVGSKSVVEQDGPSDGVDPSLPLEPSDGYLLMLSWEHIGRAYPAFSAALRARDSKLHGRITAALALPPVYFQKNLAAAQSAESRSKVPSANDAPQPSTATSADEGQPRAVGSQRQDEPDVAEQPELGLGVDTAKLPETQLVPNVASVDEPTQARLSGADRTTSVNNETPHLALQQLSTSTGDRSLSVSPEHPEEGESLFSVSLNDTPSRNTVQPYDTPLADTSISMVLQSPVMDTPSFVSADRSVEGSADRTVSSPYVKNLTPIFASAEGPSKREGAEGMEEAGVSPVRKMDALMSPEAPERPTGELPGTTMSSPTPYVPVHSHPGAKAASEPATPSQTWQVYPPNSALASPSPASDSRLVNHARPASHQKPVIPVRKLSANIQIV